MAELAEPLPDIADEEDQNKHQDSKPEDVFKCVWCKESYSSLDLLTRHMKKAKHFEEDGWLTDGEKDSGAATSDYRAEEQRNVSDQSGEKAQCNGNEEEDHGGSCEKVEHCSDNDSDDIEEKAEIVLNVIKAQCSDICREKGNKLFKEKKVGF